MSELSTIAKLLSAIDDARTRLSDHLGRRPSRDVAVVAPVIDLFAVDDGADIGVAVRASAARADGRQVWWIVEAWLYPVEGDAWLATVKAEVDLDDASAQDRCVVNEQRIVRTAAELGSAVERAVATVLALPLEPLLTPGWEPADWT